MTGGEEKKNIYRTIVKATGLFGGTQVFTILCSIIKTKLVAIWLEAEGVGIIGLYNNTVEMISSLTRLGIGTSSVRDLSKAFKSGDESRFRRTGVCRASLDLVHRVVGGGGYADFRSVVKPIYVW